MAYKDTNNAVEIDKIYWDSLTEDELSLLKNVSEDEVERELINQIKLLTVRERRFLHRIAKERDADKIIKDTDIHKFEAELTKLQRVKTQTIESLERMRVRKQKGASCTQDDNSILAKWTEYLIENDADLE